VYLRDTKYLVEIALLAWFWFSAVVYPYVQFAEAVRRVTWLPSWAPLVNPMVDVITAFQRFFYNPPDGLPQPVLDPAAGLGWYLRNLAIVGAVAVGLFFLALNIFGRLEDNLGEEI
jgi:ABC-type polysaccharide/polyol phosphate export permease